MGPFSEDGNKRTYKEQETAKKIYKFTGGPATYGGMHLRDFMATQIAAKIMERDLSDRDQIAKIAYSVADALIREKVRTEAEFESLIK